MSSLFMLLGRTTCTPLTVQVSTTTDHLDVTWSSSSSYNAFLRSTVSSAPNFIITVRDNADEGQEWTIIIHDGSASAIRLDTSNSGIVGTPVVTVRGCGTSQRIADGVESYSVVSTGSGSASPATLSTVSSSSGDESLLSSLSRLSLQQPSSSTVGAAAAAATGVRLVTSLEGRHKMPQFGVNLRPVVHIERETYRQAAVTWTWQSYSQMPDKWQVILENIENSSKLRIYFAESGIRRVDLQEKLTAGKRYRVTVKALVMSAASRVAGSSRNTDNYRTVGEESAEFRAVLTLSEIRQLHQKAVRNVYSNTTCRVLYRNKAPTYFQKMFNEDGGVMKVYAKDNSGDQASPINGQIDGLFFMAEVEPGTLSEPYHASAFGSTRLIVPIQVLLDLAPNLYFSDFYCMRGCFHYITLVMAKPGSVADQFCQEHLLSISINDRASNPFLFQGDDGKMKVACGVKVEVLYTENIDVNHLRGYMGAVIKENIPLIGKGSSTPGGLPKRANCPTCNLYPSYGGLFALESF